MDQTNLEQKIDAIYEMLKQEQKRNTQRMWFKIIFWVTMIGYSYYFMAVTLPNLIDNIIPDIPQFWNSSQTDSLSTSQLLESVKDLLPKSQ